MNVNFNFKPVNEYTRKNRDAIPPMEDVAFDDKKNKAVQDKHKYDIFPFTDIGSILQNI